MLNYQRVTCCQCFVNALSLLDKTIRNLSPTDTVASIALPLSPLSLASGALALPGTMQRWSIFTAHFHLVISQISIRYIDVYSIYLYMDIYCQLYIYMYLRNTTIVCLDPLMWICEDKQVHILIQYVFVTTHHCGFGVGMISLQQT